MNKKLTIVIAGLMTLSFIAGYALPSPVQGMSKMDVIENTLTSAWVFKTNKEELEEKALSGMTYFEKDPYTTYMSAKQADYFNSQVNGSQSAFGFGFGFLNEDLVVTTIMEDSPAQEAGLLPGDIITNIAGQNGSVQNQLLTAKENTKKTFTFHLLRDGQAKEVKMKPVDGEFSVGYAIQGDVIIIHITTFGEKTANQVKRLAKSFAKSGYQKLILDLRDNTGGYIDAAKSIASLFVDDHSFLYYFQEAHHAKEKVYSSGKPIWQPKMVILQNEQTASASEMLIASLQGQKSLSVTTVGVNSFGKNLVQNFVSFNDGSNLKYTSAMWYPKNKENIYHKGLKPDIQAGHKSLEIPIWSGKAIKDDTVADLAKPTQQMLKALGYETTRTDTYYNSRAAMEAFEQEHGLNVDGIISEKDYDSLVQAYNVFLRQVDDDQMMKEGLAVMQA